MMATLRFGVTTVVMHRHKNTVLGLLYLSTGPFGVTLNRSVQPEQACTNSFGAVSLQTRSP